MDILNLYAGTGGNRKLWTNVNVTAVESREDVAAVYKTYFPDDKVIIADAHQYLLDHYKEYDFIWASPPCPTHSILNWTKKGNGLKMKYPDMSLYQEIIFLKHWFEGKFVVENVIPYYDPLIQPSAKVDRHFWWSNFKISKYLHKRPFNMSDATIKEFEQHLGFDLSGFKLKKKINVLRNCVEPATGLHIFNCAMDIVTKSNNKQQSLF